MYKLLLYLFETTNNEQYIHKKLVLSFEFASSLGTPFLESLIVPKVVKCYGF